MRETAYIIAEYNPFHTGHLRHIQETRNAGAQRVICIMSGNFVQRGDIAFCDKHLRAESAVRCGADLVLELPLPYVLSGAPAFAEGAAKIASACGVPGTLSFGSVYDLDAIETLLSETRRPAVQSLASQLCRKKGSPYPAALAAAVKEITGEDAAAPLSDPNSVLALEYINQFQKLCPSVDFYSVRRPLPHDASSPIDGFAAAKYIRDVCYSGEDFLKTAKTYIPSVVLERMEADRAAGLLPSDKTKFSVAVMSRLFCISSDQFREVNGVSQGLENRIRQAILETSDLFALFDRVKTKRFTHARIRQAVLSAALHINRNDIGGSLPYVRVLGMNGEGRAILREIKKEGKVPFVMNISEAPDCRLRTLDCDAGKLFELCRPIPRNINAEYPAKPYII